VFTAVSLLLVPARTWQKVAEAQRGIGFIVFISLLPLIALSSLMEGYSLMRWGKSMREFGGVIMLSRERAVQFELLQILLGLALVFAGGKIVQWLGHGFNFEARYRDCFTVVAYGLTPIFLARFLNSMPGIDPWICWALGSVGIMLVLYQGIGWVLKPSPTKGFGIYFLNGLTLIVLSGVCQLIAQSFLTGKIPL
jgi:hypothetical protein